MTAIQDTNLTSLESRTRQEGVVDDSRPAGGHSGTLDPREAPPPILPSLLSVEASPRPFLSESFYGNGRPGSLLLNLSTAHMTPDYHFSLMIMQICLCAGIWFPEI